MSKINEWDRSVYLDCKENFCNVQAELEVDEPVRNGVEEEDDDERRRGNLTDGSRISRPSDCDGTQGVKMSQGTIQRAAEITSRLVYHVSVQKDIIYIPLVHV